MLSDQERKSLLDVERQLMAEDPEFVRIFHNRLRRGPEEPMAAGGAAKIAIVVSLVLSVILLLAGLPGAAGAGAVTAGLLWGMTRSPRKPDGSSTPICTRLREWWAKPVP